MPVRIIGFLFLRLRIASWFESHAWLIGLSWYSLHLYVTTTSLIRYALNTLNRKRSIDRLRQIHICLETLSRERPLQARIQVNMP